MFIACCAITPLHAEEVHRALLACLANAQGKKADLVGRLARAMLGMKPNVTEEVYYSHLHVLFACSLNASACWFLAAAP